MDDEWRHGNILKIVLSGGDADTNAAVAGAILGAKFGICHILDEWRNGLLYASMLHDKVRGCNLNCVKACS